MRINRLPMACAASVAHLSLKVQLAATPRARIEALPR